MPSKLPSGLIILAVAFAVMAGGCSVAPDPVVTVEQRVITCPDSAAPQWCELDSTTAVPDELAKLELAYQQCKAEARLWRILYQECLDNFE